MPRRTRILLDGVALHVVQRGHNRQPCFFAERDRHAYLHWLGQALETHGVALHAYVLMTNHVHLLVTPERAAELPKLVISLGRRYVQYINRSYRRTGTLWDSRYRTSIVHGDSYLLLCYRYIELNPVRAVMVPDPADYLWSSYRANALGQSNALLTAHPIYEALGATAAGRQQAYRSLFCAEMQREAMAGIRLALDQGQPLGDAGFLDRVAKAVGERRQPRPRGRPRKAKDRSPMVK